MSSQIPLNETVRSRPPGKLQKENIKSLIFKREKSRRLVNDGVNIVL